VQSVAAFLGITLGGGPSVEGRAWQEAFGRARGTSGCTEVLREGLVARRSKPRFQGITVGVGGFYEEKIGVMVGDRAG